VSRADGARWGAQVALGSLLTVMSVATFLHLPFQAWLSSFSLFTAAAAGSFTVSKILGMRTDKEASEK